MDLSTAQSIAFTEATATAMATYAGHDVAALPNDIRDLLLNRASLVIPEGTAAEDLQKYYGRRLKPLFAINKGNNSVNFGSFGVSPTYVLARKQLWSMHQEADSDVWVRLEGPSAYTTTRTAVANFINKPVDDGMAGVGLSIAGQVDPSEVFFVDNVGEAANVVARSFLANSQFAIDGATNTKQKRTILYFANQYPMVKAAVAYYSELVAAGCNIAIKEVTMSPEMLTDRPLFASTVAAAVTEHEADFLIMDHICWCPAYVLPIVEICKAVKAARPSCFISIDGAHAIGQISLAQLFAEADKEVSPLFDAYFTNCHKWLICPRHIAVLWVPKRHQRHLHPNLISNQYRGFAPDGCLSATEDRLLDRTHPTKVQAEFYWCGTKDMSNWMVLGDALAYRRGPLGGDSNIMRYNRWLAAEAARAVANIWGTHTLIPDAAVATSQGCLSTVRAPTDDASLNAKTCRQVLEFHNTFAPPVTFNNTQYVRLSAQVYNCIDDYIVFAKEYLKALKLLQEP